MLAFSIFFIDNLIFIKVASFGGYMLKENIMTLSFAPRDSHKAQIQFALERGVPAFVAMLGTRRLPFPAYSFDLVHCSRCLIPFTAYSEYPHPHYVLHGAAFPVYRLSFPWYLSHESSIADGTYFIEVDRWIPCHLWPTCAMA